MDVSIVIEFSVMILGTPSGEALTHGRYRHANAAVRNLRRIRVTAAAAIPTLASCRTWT
jgi:hypothetical protein